MLYKKPKAALKANRLALPKTPKKLKRASVSALKKKADATFSIYIRYRTARFERGEWVVDCVTCGVTKPVRQMQNGHFVSRKVTALRYDERNCNPQCPRCNMFNQGELYLYGVWLDGHYGAGTAAELMARRWETHKLTIPELEDIIRTSREKALAVHPEAFKSRTKTSAARLSVLRDELSILKIDEK